MRVFEFTIPLWPPTELRPNTAKPGPHWTTRAWLGHLASLKAEYGQAVYIYALGTVQRAEWEAPEKVRLIITFLSPATRRPDDTNLLAAFKCGLDACVRAGALRDDSPACVVETIVRHGPGLQNNYKGQAVKVRIEEMTNYGTRSKG